MSLNRTSQLEAVNSMLTAIGEAPVNSISPSSLTQDAAIALNVLEEINREVQAIGWYFNREFKVVLTRDSNNQIPVTDNMMEVDADTIEHPYIEVTMRGKFLYDIAKETGNRLEFDTDLTSTIVYLLEFTDLPQPARQYITTRAARVLADRVVGSADLSRMLREDENLAMERLNESEARMADSNYLDDPRSQWSKNRYI